MMDDFGAGMFMVVFSFILMLVGAAVDSWVISTDCDHYGYSTIAFERYECKRAPLPKVMQP